MFHKIESNLCECGDVTVYVLDSENRTVASVCMSKNIFETKYPFSLLELNEQEYNNCNSCANNWSVEKCACGSGEHFEDCEEGFEECGTPYQDLESIEEYVEDYVNQQ